MRLTRMIAIVLAGTIFLELSAAATQAHEIPWRAGVSRQVGYGHCAKGPCTQRTCWAPSRPHRHVGGKMVIDRASTADCWNGSRELRSR